MSEIQTRTFELRRGSKAEGVQLTKENGAELLAAGWIDALQPDGSAKVEIVYRTLGPDEGIVEPGDWILHWPTGEVQCLYADHFREEFQEVKD